MRLKINNIIYEYYFDGMLTKHFKYPKQYSK